MTDLPFLLAGPIVRRVDPNHAAFWVATSSATNVTAKVWSGPQTSTGPLAVSSGDSVVATGTAASRKFGAQLHVTVVVADASTVMAPGQLFSYDLTFDGAGNQGLRDLGLLRDEKAADRTASKVHADAPLHLALGYALDRLPSFATCPASLADLILAQGSCRKTNGDGPDAMAFLDDVISDHLDDPLERPHQLFLTGDQIYADEVATALLPALNALSQDLLGYTEQLPLGANATEVTMTQLPATRRQRTVRDLARFSTTAGQNHVMGYGEYAAMYLSVWSPRVWRTLATLDEVFVANANIDANHLTNWEACFDNSTTKWKADRKKDFDAETKALETFRAAVPRVARVLANTSTYMILDDHEVTDDWYLSKSWRTRVLTAPLGRALIRNALGAYAVFQAWGNDPAAFTHTSGAPAPDNEKLLTAVSGMVDNGASLSNAVRDQLDDLLGLTQPVVDAKVTFHFGAVGPMHQVRVLDTRTRRRYVGERESPAKLVGDSLDSQLPKGPLSDGRELLVVVSAAPVLFPRALDTFVQPVAAGIFDFATHVTGVEKIDPCSQGKPISGREEFDLESWHGDEAHHEAFLRRAGTYKRTIILSGDVHFSSSMQLDFWNKGDDTVDARIVQFTSSALRNPPDSRKQAVLRALRFGQQLLQGAPFERLGWDDKAPIQVPSGQAIRPGRRARMSRTPSLNRADGWPAGTTIPADKAPDWRWRLRVLRDDRRRTDMDVIPQAVPPALPPFNAADPVATYAVIAGKHAEVALSATMPLRLMVFVPNVSLVRFEAVGNDYEARHVIISQDSPDATTGSAFTEHRAALDLNPSLPAPQLQTV